jgi:OmpA-OmpF porin, OOP family
MTIKTTLSKLLLASAAAAFLVTTPAAAADGDKSTIKGLITEHSGNTLTVVDSNNVKQVINLTPTTQVKAVEGALQVRESTAMPTALIPGLRISADVVAAGAGFDATKVKFKPEDLRTAQAVQAGVDQTAAQAEANKARLNDFGTNETLMTTDVLFATGSTAISAQGKSDLMAFAAKAKATKGYQVVVDGYTDSTGNAAANERLSKQRANAVINFLQQKAGLSTARVRSGNGMGVAPDAGAGSNAGARKVTARLFVDKGVAGGGR